MERFLSVSIKNIKKVAATALFAMGMPLFAYAVPAKPGLVTVKQADGTELKVQLRGDERHHFILSEDGYLIKEKAGNYYFAEIDAQQNVKVSDIKATNVDSRSAEAQAFLNRLDKQKIVPAMEKERVNAAPNRAAADGDTHKGLFAGTSFPSSGDVKALVVLVEYQDVQFNTANPYEYFDELLNGENFTQYNASGSCAKYYKDQSNGVFRPQFDLYGPITLSNNMSYYGGNNYLGNDSNPQKMAIEACQQLDGTVDFSQYDTDGDGYIDNIYVFYAGRGEADGGSANTVWPHSWNISEAEYYSSYYFDGVKLDRYACSNEWDGYKPDGIGTFCHEFAHVMGLPDLYATSYTSAFTPGDWSVMDSGPYNNDGRTPPAFSIFERNALRWVEPKVLDGPNSIRLTDIKDSNAGCIIKTGKDTEFFLLENRQQKGWDKYIPGHGMLIWHIDYNESVWEQNTVNNSSSHQYVDLEEADNQQNEYSRAGDSFPGTSGKTSFTDDTKPSMKTWSGAKLELPITDIKETNGVITFDVAGGRVDIPAPTAYEATDIQPGGFVASWSKVDEPATGYALSVYTVTTSGMKESRTYADGWNQKAVGDVLEMAVTGLSPETEYCYEVFATDGRWYSEASNRITVVTADSTLAYRKPMALEATDVTDGSFTANWLPVKDATFYQVVVAEVTTGDCKTDGCDFTGGINAMPDGWVTSSKLTYANDAYSGNAIPALRMGTADSYVSTPVYAEDVEAVTFWHRGSSVPEANSLYVYAMSDKGVWSRVETLPICNEAGGKTVTVSQLPPQTRSVKVEYHMEEKKGAVAIDDITVEYGRQVVYDYVHSPENPLFAEAWEETEGVMSVPVADLKNDTPYIYYIVACDESACSYESDRISVTTASKATGITSVKATGNGECYNLNGQRVAKPGKGLYIINGKKTYNPIFIH